MSQDPIKHVVLLMFENRSFDQMLGCFREVYPDLEGIDPANPSSNVDPSGQVFPQSETNAISISPDPKHELENVLHQMEGGNANFVRDYAECYPTSTAAEREQVMGFYPIGFLPALHALAQHFTICDHWFSSVPGPTWTNRFFAYSGTSRGRVAMPEGVFDTDKILCYDQDTLFDRLNERGIKWRIYFGDVPNSLVLRHQRTVRNAPFYRLMNRFYANAAGPEADFPAFALIEPNYLWGDQNDDHPPHSTMRAQELLADVYNALRKNERLWNSTLLVILYDEHGGFFDHVEPPGAVPPDDDGLEYAFDRLGIRVPALLVSPWVERGIMAVDFDHTSLLSYLSRKWHLSPLTRRSAAANTIGIAIRTSGHPRMDTPDRIEMPQRMQLMAASEAAAQGTGDLNHNQRALLAFAEYLEQEMDTVVAESTRMAMTALPLDEAERAKLRVEAFLDQQKMKAGGG